MIRECVCEGNLIDSSTCSFSSPILIYIRILAKPKFLAHLILNYRSFDSELNAQFILHEYLFYHRM